ncbi:hypothetical protein FISHEDRAFT_58972 [Fistulina hepatica ATCC 64428]|uniref:Uncharacterized protein n=1 Tax=Fistulina hepatica ATCC 64428 TaxID=1128425 RepID=A0A0D7ADK1_9AGAR|nr:hypothetical protein FISHEDRAFT_58972 [Fistulina hepatica ATCC 64428]
MPALSSSLLETLSYSSGFPLQSIVTPPANIEDPVMYALNLIALFMYVVLIEWTRRCAGEIRREIWENAIMAWLEAMPRRPGYGNIDVKAPHLQVLARSGAVTDTRRALYTLSDTALSVMMLRVRPTFKQQATLSIFYLIQFTGAIITLTMAIYGGWLAMLVILAGAFVGHFSANLCGQEIWRKDPGVALPVNDSAC